MLLEPPCPDKARADLEFDRLLVAIADRTQSPAGRRAAESLSFLSTRQAIETAFAEGQEALSAHYREEPLVVGDVPEIEASLERARIGASLSREELIAVVGFAGAARSLRRYLRSREEEMPHLCRALATDPTLDELEDELRRAFDDDGNLADRASPRLGELRSQLRASRARMVRRLEDLLRRYEAVLQDRYWTERDGRYVLPVRADAHERFPGIVHDTSDSGQTLFVEPRVVVPMGNRHKVLEAEVQREEEAILAGLSAEVGARVESVAAAVRALIHADVVRAVAQLGADLALVYPTLAPDGEHVVDLKAARHPLLSIDGVDVVPSDLRLDGGKALVVSGPNAGGKTVALKTAGLCALMVRAGLPIPAAAGSRVSLFQRVLTDVGDDQSLHKNLSTFSAHIQNLAQILDDTHAGVLVLLDELAGGTDPREGEALATALLDSLCARGGAVGCTTHYEGLKAAAVSDERYENASVGFDLRSMNPTFRLTIGVPGSSSALAVARRFGIPGPVIERAEGMLNRESHAFDQLVEKLEAQQAALVETERKVAAEAAQLEAARRELEAERDRLKTREQRAITTEGEELLRSLKQAREDLRATKARIRDQAEPQELKRVERKLDSISGKVSLGSPLDKAKAADEPDRGAIRPEDVRLGLRVFVPRIRAEAEVVEILSSGQLRVAAGPLKLLANVAELRASGKPKPAPSKSNRRAASPSKNGDAARVAMQTSDNTVDLRGMRTHEAVERAEQFLDECLGGGVDIAYLIHGHGTGALRDGIRKMLATSPYVEKFHPAEGSEGGDGVSVVYLR